MINTNDANTPENGVNPEITVDLTINVHLRKHIKAKTSDYVVINEGSDEYGCYSTKDFSNCDFEPQIEKEIEDSLPSSDWEIDDYEYVVND